MKAYGNGTPQQCVLNLMSMVKGECPYERCKGLDDSLSGQPVTGVFGEVVTEVYWNLQNYEPRAKEQDINLIMQDFIRGKATIATSLITNGG